VDDVTEFENLEALHAAVVRLQQQIAIPDPLMAKTNARYRKYIRDDPRSGYYRWLAAATAVLRPRRILELGTFRGASSLCMYASLCDPSQELTTCDIRSAADFVPEQMRRDPRVRIVVGDDLDLATFGSQPPTDIDLLFIDTVHSRAHVSAEWALYQPRCRAGALIVLDDIQLNDMPEFWNSITLPKLDVSADCHHSGFGIVLNGPPS
jgi:predicted O-methyltransferase YrrM